MDRNREMGGTDSPGIVMAAVRAVELTQGMPKLRKDKVRVKNTWW